MLHLESLRPELAPPKPQATFEIDMSAFFPRTVESEGSPVLFTYRRFRVNDIFGVQERAEIVKRQRPEWTERMCAEVASLMVCHLEPAAADKNPLTVTMFYCDLFSDEEKDPQLMLVLSEFGIKAGANFLRDMTEATEARKKNSKSPTSSRRRNTRRSPTVSPTSIDTPPK